eukprot:gene25472-34024_t
MVPRPNRVIPVSETFGLSSSAEQIAAKTTTTFNAVIDLPHLNVWNPISGRSDVLRVLDGGGSDYSGILALIRRKISPRSLDVRLVPVRWKYSYNTFNQTRHVFPESDWDVLYNGLVHSSSRSGREASFLLRTRVIHNPITSVHHGGWDVTILFVVNDPCLNWQKSVDESLLKELHEDHNRNNFPFNPSNYLNNYSTLLMNLLREDNFSTLVVNSLSQMAAWEMLQFTRNWDVRSLTLIQEIRSYNPDILCLQDVDHFTEWWRPQLMLLGYDSVFKKRTEVKDFRNEGVVIAYKSDLFQLFKTVTIEFNQAVQNNDRGSVFRARSITDDVGLLLYLQPYTNALSTAVCVASAMLSSSEADSDVRMAQCQYLAEQIERSNRDFQVPVVIGWKSPSPSPRYRICWRPGGSRVLDYSAERKVGAGDCVRYVKQFDADNNVKIITLKELECIISGLTSDVPYEFKISAINDMGEGIMSDPSDPVVMDNASTAPAMPDLVSFYTLASLMEGRELSWMKQNDWNANREVKNDEVLNSATQTTPRTLDGMKTRQVPRGSVLPIGVNPRAGWKESLGGTKDPGIRQDLARESVLSRSILRNREGFKNPGFNQYSETIVPYIADDSAKNDEAEHSEEVDEEQGSRTGRPNGIGQPEDGQEEEEEEDFEDNGSEAFSIERSVGLTSLTSQVNGKNTLPVSLPISLETLPLLNSSEDVSIVDTPTTETKDNSLIRIPNPRQVHNLNLRSAYESYSSADHSHIEGIQCFDYLFYSSSGLVTEEVLSIPPISELRGETPTEPLTSIDAAYASAFPVCGKLFDERVKKIYTDLKIPVSSSSSSSSQSVPAPSRHTVNDFKRKLKEQLTSTYQFLENGVEATRKLREGGYGNFVIGVTGNILEDDVWEYLSAGADMIMGKPVKVVLLKLLLQYVRESGALSRPEMYLMEDEHAHSLDWRRRKDV